MSTLTISLPEDTARRLKALAASRGISLDELMEEMSTAAVTAYDAETRFRALAAKDGRDAALEVLARLDRQSFLKRIFQASSKTLKQHIRPAVDAKHVHTCSAWRRSRNRLLDLSRRQSDAVEPEQLVAGL